MAISVRTYGISLPRRLVGAGAISFSRLRKPELNKNRPPARNRSVPVLRLKTTDKILPRPEFPVALFIPHLSRNGQLSGHIRTATTDYAVLRSDF